MLAEVEESELEDLELDDANDDDDMISDHDGRERCNTPRRMKKCRCLNLCKPKKNKNKKKMCRRACFKKYGHDPPRPKPCKSRACKAQLRIACKRVCRGTSA